MTSRDSWKDHWVNRLTDDETSRLIGVDIRTIRKSWKLSLIREKGLIDSDYTIRYTLLPSGRKEFYDVEVYIGGAIRFLGEGDMEVGEKLFNEFIAEKRTIDKDEEKVA